MLTTEGIVLLAKNYEAPKKQRILAAVTGPILVSSSLSFGASRGVGEWTLFVIMLIISAFMTYNMYLAGWAGGKLAGFDHFGAINKANEVASKGTILFDRQVH